MNFKIYHQFLGQSRFSNLDLMQLWVPINLTGKISDSCIIYLGFNPYLHQKPIDILVWWQRVIIKSGCLSKTLSQIYIYILGVAK